MEIEGTVDKEHELLLDGELEKQSGGNIAHLYRANWYILPKSQDKRR